MDFLLKCRIDYPLTGENLLLGCSSLNLSSASDLGEYTGRNG